MTDSDRAAAWLAQVRSDWNRSAVGGKPERHVGRLLAALEAVLAIHEPTEIAGVKVCMYCLDSYGEHVEWPCAEYKAISAVLPGESRPRLRETGE